MISQGHASVIFSSLQPVGRKLRWGLTTLFGISRLTQLAEEQRNIQAYTAWLALLATPKHRRERALAPHGFKVYSQAEEDGIIHEILRRIGATSRTFVEIGVSDGRECNTRLLLRQGWRGVWIDGSEDFARQIRSHFARELASGVLTLVREFVTRESINAQLAAHTLWREVDLFSIDIDGNDYHVLEAIDGLSARIIVLEYNPVIAPPGEWIAAYDPKRWWQGGDDYSASLKSYELLLAAKGYALVACTLNGNNAFFVRRDLLGDHFVPEYSAEYHYEPQRYWLTHGFVGGH